MAGNWLVTGPPRSGKTTVIERTTDRLTARGYTAGGIVCPEIREAGERVGFEITDLLTVNTGVLAHVDREEGPQVGKYRVDVAMIDVICEAAFSQARREADFVVVDEIAPMEVHSDVFVREVRRVLDGPLPVVAAVHYRSREGFIGEVKTREDTTMVEVTEETREALPERLVDHLLEILASDTP